MHTYACLYREVCFSSLGFLSGGFVRGFFVWKVLFGLVFVRPPLLSEYISYNRRLNITFNFRFHMYEKNLKSVRSHALGPPPLCHKLSHLLGPPSSVMYFYGRPHSYLKGLLCFYCNALTCIKIPCIVFPCTTMHCLCLP